MSIINATLSIVESNNMSFEHGDRFFFNGTSTVIFICPSCFNYFKFLYLAQNFCFEEFRKCLSEKHLKEGGNLTFRTEFERLT